MTGSPRSSCQPTWFSDEPFLPGLKNGYLLAVSSHGRKTEQTLQSLLERTLISSWEPHPCNLSKPNYLPKVPFPNTNELGVRVLIYGFKKGTLQTIIFCLCPPPSPSPPQIHIFLCSKYIHSIPRTAKVLINSASMLNFKVQSLIKIRYGWDLNYNLSWSKIPLQLWSQTSYMLLNTMAEQAYDSYTYSQMEN